MAQAAVDGQEWEEVGKRGRKSTTLIIGANLVAPIFWEISQIITVYMSIVVAVKGLPSGKDGHSLIDMDLSPISVNIYIYIYSFIYLFIHLHIIYIHRQGFYLSYYSRK